MKHQPGAGRIGRLHRHIRLLLLLTVIVRGGMFLGYPFQEGVDDNQGYQRYLIERLLDGDLLIGSIRYNTGYPLVIAPVAAVGQLFGRLDEHFLLLVQVSLSALIPFLLYDLVRRRHSRRAALVVALLALFDAHGLQWAHLSLPVWLAALCLTLSLWLIERAGVRGGGGRIPLLLAGLALGLAVLARLSVAPVAALIAMLLLSARAVPLRRRLAAVLTLAAACLAPLLGYVLLIHYPSTGVLRPSCVAGVNLLESVKEAGIPVVAENGEVSARLLRLNALPADPAFEHRIGPALWQRPGPWVSPQALMNFREQAPPPDAPEVFDVFLRAKLEWYLGPCEVDSLSQAAALEAVGARPLQFAQSLPAEVLRLLGRTGRWHLPHVDSLEFHEDDDFPFPLQRARSRQGGAYRGNLLWPAPMAVWSHLREVLAPLNWLVVPALALALWRRRPVFTPAAVILLFQVVFLAVFDWSEGRVAAPLWPLWPLLIGGLLAEAWQGLTSLRGAGP